MLIHGVGERGKPDDSVPGERVCPGPPTLQTSTGFGAKGVGKTNLETFTYELLVHKLTLRKNGKSVESASGERGRSRATGCKLFKRHAGYLVGFHRGK